MPGEPRAPVPHITRSTHCTQNTPHTLLSCLSTPTSPLTHRPTTAQNLCDDFLHGDVDPNMFGGKAELTCRAVIDRKGKSTFSLALCALVPGLVLSPIGPNMERAPRAKGEVRLLLVRCYCHYRHDCH